MSDYFSANNVASTRWLTEEVFKLIELVQRDEAIYNPRHKYYFCRPYVENFWREVDQKLDKNPGASLAKWTNLRISFRREFTNYLEEQVPPCWSYFDRMFFLHPYLRKKQQLNSKTGEATLQETLAQISELSNRLERRAAKEAAAKNNNPSSEFEHLSSSTRYGTAQSSGEQPPLHNSDSYFEYYDEVDQNNSELDDIAEDEQQREIAVRYPQVILETAAPHDKIKSECEDEVQEEDYDRELSEHETEPPSEIQNRSNVNAMPISTTSSTRLGKRTHQQQRLEHLNRLQTRSYHEDLRAKRPHSQERLASNAQTTTSSLSNSGGATSSASAHGQRVLCTSTPTHSNVSFVRPTFTKPVEATTTTILSSNSNSSNVIIDADAVSVPTSSSQVRHNQHYAHHSQRLDSSAVLSASSVSVALNANVGASGNNPITTHQHVSPTQNAAATTPHLELCDCKTDPDAMFLMSLLPDIQKLNGRDRGKIKIAFQNILQDYLYPD